MIDRIKKLLNGDLIKYGYLITDIKQYKLMRVVFLSIASLLIVPVIVYMFNFNYLTICISLLSCIFAWRIPYMLLKLNHNAACNNIMNAVPLWINTLYSLLGENNIDNAIIMSYEVAPECMKSDLKLFIEQIQDNLSEKQIYTDFLSTYEISGLKEIMMKLYEFRNLSKENLRFEILSLNKSLARIEEMNMIKRSKGEIMMADMMAIVLISIPSIYLMVLQDVLTQIIM